MLHRQGGLSVKRFSLSHNRFASMCRVVKPRTFCQFCQFSRMNPGLTNWGPADHASVALVPVLRTQCLKESGAAFCIGSPSMEMAKCRASCGYFWRMTTRTCFNL